MHEQRVKLKRQIIILIFDVARYQVCTRPGYQLHATAFEFHDHVLHAHMHMHEQKGNMKEFQRIALAGHGCGVCCDELYWILC